MQKHESAYLFSVAKRIAKELPDCPILPIHDSLLVPDRFVDLTKEIMADEMYKLGVRPVIESE